MTIFSAALLFSGGCGGYSAPATSSTTVTEPAVPPSQAAKRAFLINEFAGSLIIIDSQNDVAVGRSFFLFSQPQFIVPLSNKTSLVYHATSNAIALIDNQSEISDGLLATLPGATENIVVTADNKFAYAAIPSIGKIAMVDIVNRTVTNFPADPAVLPGVRRLAITHNGKTVLAFSDNSNTVSFLDTATNTITTSAAVFDQAYNAVISADDSKAYVLDCGKECGGTQAGITPVALATNTPGATIVVTAATVGIADSTNLYVAGTDVTATPNAGVVSAMNLSTLAVTKASAPISDGLHTTMGLAANSKLYIGAKACSNAGGKCLSVYNIGGGTASVISDVTVPPAFGIGDVQAITPIAGRSVVYIIQNGQFLVYDSATDKPVTPQNVTASGRLSDVKEIN